MPWHDQAKIEVLENPAGLSEGSAFSIKGSEWVVANRNGNEVAVSEDGRESFNLDGVAASGSPARGHRARRL